MHTILTQLDALKDIVLLPGHTLHASDGRQIGTDQIADYIARGEKVEICHQGRSVGRMRPSKMVDRFTPRLMDVMSRLSGKAQQENFDQAVNWIDRKRNKFWCPICAKNQSHPLVISFWVSPEPECALVCYYAICKRCGKQGHDLQALAHCNIRYQEAFIRITDLAEQHLVARYPYIAVNLPPGYMNRSND